MGGAVSAGEDNDELIDNLVEAEYIKTPAIERIFRAVDRADYYVEGCKENAYRDLAWKHGNLHLSAPCIYSEVMESLKLAPGMSFLNLGSGTGYLSTMVGLVLGPYGTNHGVELHCDVVNYARSKLDEFQTSSPALDKYEFCCPSFVIGNCLLLDCSMHQYDRVYCGASCPTEHENYMKNLIRIGGILVMPLNDHLLQITRTAETSWEVKNILPVSFASLVLPSSTESLTSVKLPESFPLSLQEICRSTIRVLLRKNIDIENPTLKDKKRHHPKWKKAKRCVRRIVIPIFEESDDSRRSSQADVNDNFPAESPKSDDQKDEVLSQVVKGEGASVNGESTDKVVDVSVEPGTSAELPEKMEVVASEDIQSNHKDTKKVNSLSVPEVPKNGRNKHKQTNGDDATDYSDDSSLEEISDSEMTGSEQDDVSHNRKPGEGQSSDSADRKRSAEEDDDDPRTNRRSNNLYLGKRATAMIFKRVAFSDVDSEPDSDSEKDCSPKKCEDESPKTIETGDYTYFMKQKIHRLPLPHTLKVYLNFSRPV